MESLKGVVFDMDDTLYPENAYVQSGFRAVSIWLSTHGWVQEEQAFEFLWRGHLEERRGNTFDSLMEAFPGLNHVTELPELVQIYREHPPVIAMFPAMEALLKALKTKGIPTALISDGRHAVQTRKIAALGLQDLIDEIFLTDTWGSNFWKPHQRAYQEAEQALRLHASDLVYVADNPLKDFQTPKALGWRTLWAAFPERVHIYTGAEPGTTALAKTPQEAADLLLNWLHLGKGALPR